MQQESKHRVLQHEPICACPLDTKHSILGESIRDIDINMEYANVKMLNSVRDQEGVKEGLAFAYGSVETEK